MVFTELIQCEYQGVAPFRPIGRGHGAGRRVGHGKGNRMALLRTR